MPILAIDHGEKRIGLAISDRTDSIARPLIILAHSSRAADAEHVARLAKEHEVTAIIVGESTDEDGLPNLAGRRAGRFAVALRAATAVPVLLWDESLTTQDARQRRVSAGISQKKRRGRIDAEAAAMLLQSYLESRRDLDSRQETD